MVIGEIFIELKLSNNNIESKESKNLKKKWFFA
ncbi:ion transporter, partial [Streptococcus pneumoniae]